MKSGVEEAIRELEAAYPEKVRHVEDGEGGAFVLVEDIDLGEHYAPRRAWIAFRIAWTYDEVPDVYPHFIDAQVRYTGEGPRPSAAPSGLEGDALPDRLARGHKAPGFDLDAIQISRQSNTPGEASALGKLVRIIAFLRSR